MPRTITLPTSNAAVTLRDKREITERQRRPFMRLQAATQIEGGDRDRMTAAGDLIDAMDVAVIVCVIGWDVKDEAGVPVPVSAEALQDLQVDDYDYLRDECLEALTKAAPSFEPSPEPDSPTPAASL